MIHAFGLLSTESQDLYRVFFFKFIDGAVGVCRILRQSNSFHVQAGAKKIEPEEEKTLERRSETRNVPGRPPNNRFRIISFSAGITFYERRSVDLLNKIDRIKWHRHSFMRFRSKTTNT